MIHFDKMFVNKYFYLLNAQIMIDFFFFLEIHFYFFKIQNLINVSLVVDSPPLSKTNMACCAVKLLKST